MTLSSFRSSLIALLGMTLLISSVARADLLTKFWDDYPGAASRIENAYSHVTINSQDSFRDENGKTRWVAQSEYMREGNLIRGISKITQSVDPTLPIGTVKAFGGSAKQYFELSKPDESAKFAIESLKTTSNFDLITRGRARPIFAPYCIFELRILDYVKKPDVRVLSANSETLDGHQVVALATRWQVNKRSDPGPRVYRFYFDPQTWLVLGWTFEHHPNNPKVERLQTRLQYQPGTNPPKLSKLEFWGELPSKPGVKIGGMLYEVKSVDFGSIPKDKFTLAAFGVEEPVSARPLSGPSWVVIVNTIAFSLLGVLFAILAIRRRHGRLV